MHEHVYECDSKSSLRVPMPAMGMTRRHAGRKPMGTVSPSISSTHRSGGRAHSPARRRSHPLAVVEIRPGVERVECDARVEREGHRAIVYVRGGTAMRVRVHCPSADRERAKPYSCTPADGRAQRTMTSMRQ